MTTTEITLRRVRPEEAPERLSRYVLADGLKVVVDLEKRMGGQDAFGLPSGHRAVQFWPHLNLTSEEAAAAVAGVARALKTL